MKKSFDPNAAANIIRQKLADIYNVEPNAKKELEEAQANPHRSKHQEYMYKLSGSGMSLADIQTEWHRYYQGLSNEEKHDVWNEFYRQHDTTQQRSTPQVSKPRVIPQQPQHRKLPAQPQTRSIHNVKNKLLTKISSRNKITSAQKKQNLRSIGFGLSMGFLTLLIFLFGFFNERFIAPFITPSNSIGNIPVITDPSAQVSKDPLLFIPKINLQIPVVYDEPSVQEDAVQAALEKGVLHYATTSSPGEKGNGVIFGHSSNNIFNNGKYKFAFVLLNELQNGDTFTVQKDGKRYVYKVFDKKVVKPSNLSVLGPVSGKKATMTLITCDPPGTSLNRLVVVGEQISPAPDTNTASTAEVDETPTILPSNSPSLWSKFVDWLSS